MKRIAILALVAVLAACGSDSSGPTNKFSGTWTGDATPDPADTLHFVFNSAQTGSAVSGSGTVSAGSTVLAHTFSGTSTPPSLAFTMTVGSETLTYAGTYITSDSIAGTITEGSTSLPLSLKKN